MSRLKNSKSVSSGYLPVSDRAPPLHMLARESASFAYMRFASSFGPAAHIGVRGNGQKVIILPGFMASDQSMGRLRRSLIAAGFDAHALGLGRNLGVDADIFSRIDARIGALGITAPVTLVGWSLGGLIAREYAKYAPDRVAKVITMGSPFSGNPRANNAWRIYELLAGYKVDAPPIDMVLHEKPPVPTSAIWSRRDGVVAAGCARGLPGESDVQIELDCTHMAFIVRPAAITAIAAAISSAV